MLKAFRLLAISVFCLSTLALAERGQNLLLPEDFSGWIKSASKTSHDALAADASNGPLLKEYRFGDFEQATYLREGRKMNVKAARFADATGAYGAFTFYKLPQMQTEKIGDQSGSNGIRVLFYKGNVLVDAKLDRLTAMSGAELRALANSLPRPQPNAANLPTLPRYLPKQSYIPNSAKFVVGPLGLGRIESPLLPNEVDFSTGAEVALGKYYSSLGVGTLTLVSYPTPQIAEDKLHALASSSRMSSASAVNQERIVEVKRTGPMVVIASGDIPVTEAKSLLASVNYDADLTWNESTSFDPKNNIGNLIVNIFSLTGVILFFALVSGLAVGGFRILARRFFPNRLVDRPEAVEFIRLDLSK